MENTSPRLWTYTPANSPVALPKQSLLFHPSELTSLDTPVNQPDSVLSGARLQEYCGAFQSAEQTVDEMLQSYDEAPMAERRPFLLLGELANPYRLQDIGIGAMPIFTSRVSELCRTYADGLDNREVNPGVHHVTLARTEGWWEKTHFGMATVPQMKQMIAWLDQGRRGTWKPVKPAEGTLHFEKGPLPSPTQENVSWDGKSEIVETAPPALTGCEIDLRTVMVAVHTQHGCYDHRGRLARCAHIGQRDFHENLFRRGSSKKWDEILEIV